VRSWLQFAVLLSVVGVAAGATSPPTDVRLTPVPETARVSSDAAGAPTRAVPTEGPASGPTAGESRFESTVKPFLVRNCYLCHNAQLKRADVNLQAFANEASVAKDLETWEKVVVRLRIGQMPPPELPRPPAEEVASVVRWIEEEIAAIERKAEPNPGRVTARRLNRTEYDNTVRDLLGVTLTPAHDFPQDDAGYGFDNNGDVLSLSPVLMEKYLSAAEKVARAALAGQGDIKPSLVRLRTRNGRVQPSPTALMEYDVQGLSLPNAFHAMHRVPVDGEYLVRIVFGGSRPAGSEPVQAALFVDGEERQTVALDASQGASFYDDKQDLSGKNVEVRTRLEAGEHWLAASIVRLYEGLPARYAGPNPSRRPAPPPPVFKPRKGATPAKIKEARARFEKRMLEVAPANEARVSMVEIVGPFEPRQGPSPASQKLVYACGHQGGHHSEGCLEKILTSLVRRAYRRPVEAADIAPLQRLAIEAQKAGESFEAALGLALQAMLVSPDFLFRIEKDRTVAAGEPGAEIDEHELASRLSYFLWASMPDEELFGAASRGVLRDPEVLAGQVRRMLKDEKASALVAAFGGQWLQFRGLESVEPDRDRFPGFDENLRLSMRRETELFLESVIREDRSLLDLIDAPYSFINQRLARHYGIPGVAGPHFRKVDLGAAPRGGVLTQASVLTMSSYATRTSPVLRGKWVLENILGAPPPDPPAGIPRLDEAKVATSGTLRQQMEAHRTNATCAACHSKMDPLGFGLENYDAIGAWRTEDGKLPIDASGKLPDERTFSGPDEMKKILKADREAFTATVTEKLLTYALGRGLERYDKRTVKAMAQRVTSGDNRFSSLVLEIVKSLPFQRRRGEHRS
jgi:hypothetical protein